MPRHSTAASRWPRAIPASSTTAAAAPVTLGDGSVGSATFRLTKTAANLKLTGGNFVINDVITRDRVADTSFNSDMYFSTGGMVTLNAQNTYFGNTFIDTNTTVQNGINNALPTDTVVTLGSGTTNGVLDLHSFNQTIAGLTTSGTGTANIITNNASGTGTSTLTVNNDTSNSNANYTFNGIIQDGSTAHTALVKSGDHELILTGNNNTYSGGTTVSSGHLAVDNTSGSGTGVGNVLVSNGGVLSGTGIIAPNVSSGVTIASGAELTPGADPSGTTASGFLSPPPRPAARPRRC